MQRLPANGLSLNDKSRAKLLLQLGGIVNKIRVVQGWNLLPPMETEPIALIWAEQFERFGVEPAAYNEIVNRAIDHRLWFLRKGEKPPELTIELLVMVYQQYRSEQRDIEENKKREDQWKDYERSGNASPMISTPAR
jgi:hypothetical protein